MSYCDWSMFVVQHQQFALKDNSIFIPGPINMKLGRKYSQTSIIRSARDCRNFFELSVVRISEIGSFRIWSDFFFIQYR